MSDGRQPGAASLGTWARYLGLHPVRSREWVGVFGGHEIRLRTRGLLPARLYIDGEFRDRRSPLLCTNRAVPLLSGRVPTKRSDVTIAHVYLRRLWPLRLDVRVAGRTVPMNPLSDA